MFVRKLHIALTADPELPVPPRLYGGIERIIDLLVRELVARGHQVTLFAHRDSITVAQLVPWPGLTSRSKQATLLNMLTLACISLRQRFDLIHSFSRVAYLAPLLPLPIPKLMTYQREISRRSISFGHRASRGTLWFSAISQHMMRHVADVGTWRKVFNGVSTQVFQFQPQVASDAPLIFLGRVEAIKGPHLAIEVARRTMRKLIIAGNIPPEHQTWFEQTIQPYLDDQQIRYIGPVDDAQKNILLGSAAALLMPILWEEPFGIVMIEAMACGTPVIGLHRGAVPEVVTHGETGFVASDLDGLVAAVNQIASLDRAACRQRVEQYFSATALANAYLAVYTDMLSQGTSSRGMKQPNYV